MLRLPELPEGRYMSVANLSALFTVRLYSEELLFVLVSVSDIVEPRATVWPAGLNQSKIQKTTSVIEPATFRLLVPQRITLREIYRITNMPPAIHNGVRSAVLSSVADSW